MITDKEITMMTEKLQEELEQYFRPDDQKVAELIRKAQGKRSQRQFASETGISTATLSRIQNGKTVEPLSLKNIVRIACHAETKDSMTAMELARASGYAQKSEADQYRRRMPLRNPEKQTFASAAPLMRKAIKIALQEHVDKKKYEAGPLTFNAVSTMFGAEVKTDFEILVYGDIPYGNNQSIFQYRWDFLFFPQRAEDFRERGFSVNRLARNVIRESSLLFLTDAWQDTHAYSPEKVSFCFADEELFDEFCRLMQNARLNHMFSAILIETRVPAVVREISFDSPFHKHSILDLEYNSQEKTEDEPVKKWTPEPEYIMVHERKVNDQ